MRVFALLAVVPALILAAPQNARACGAGGEADFVTPIEDSTTLLLTRARMLDQRAAQEDREAFGADRRARSLMVQARRMQQRAMLREGTELSEMLQRARDLAIDANEANAHARRARARASSFRMQARQIRAAALGEQPVRRRPMRRTRPVAFSL